MLRRLLAAVSLALVFACSRPVDRSFGERIVTNAKVVPEHLRANVPFDVSFSVLGVPPEKVDLEINSETFSCTPELKRDDQRYHCRLEGLSADRQPNGASVVLVHASQNGQAGTITAPFVFDSECPKIAALTVEPALAAPDDEVIVRVTADETLGAVPTFTRAGREWPNAQGSGRDYSVAYRVTQFDPAMGDITVELADVAGNVSDVCGGAGRIGLLVDRTPPVAQPELIHLLRGAPGEPASIEAEDGAFIDDVSIKAVHVISSGADGLIATLTPNARGGLPKTTLPLSPNARVLVQPIDIKDRLGEAVSVHEQWTLAFGPSATPARSIKTAQRYSSAAPNTRGMNRRTEELAPTIAVLDAHATTIRAELGFRKVGELPGRYQDAHQIVGGYDGANHTAMAIGGRIWDAEERGTYFLDDTMLIEWADQDGQYRTRPGPDLVLGPAPTTAPSPRAGVNIAFDGTGCGMLFGGEGLYYRENDDPTYYVQDDLWQLCRNGDNYQWRELIPENPEAGPYVRMTPLVWDPLGEKFVVVGGIGDCFFNCPVADDVYFLAQELSGAWRWYPYLTLPSNFDGHIHHAAWFDSRIGAPVVALGTDEFQAGTASRIWRYDNAQWQYTSITQDLYYRQGFGFAHDSSRGQTIIWGGANESNVIPESGDMNPLNAETRFVVPDPLVYILAGTATTGPSAWISRDLNYPTPRMWPTLIYDEERQVTLVFGGVRFHDTVPVDGSIYELVVEPAYPFLQAIIDLGAARPKGVERMSLTVRAAGSGGYSVELWDHAASAWVQVGASSSGAFETLVLDVSSDADRFISSDGTVPVTVRARSSATVRSEARLEVDSVRGEIALRAGVSLP